MPLHGHLYIPGVTRLAQLKTVTKKYPAMICNHGSEENPTGGTGGDNWDMDSVTVKAIGEGVNAIIFKHGSKRFTGDAKILKLKRGE